MIESVCVFCGSASGGNAVFADAARSFGTSLAERGLTLVFGGGRVGLMGIVADAVLAAGGRAIGVIPELLVQKEVAHRGLTALHVVKDMHERKRTMADLSGAFAALPGGVGTYEELFEIYTWAQLGYHAKPVGVLNTAGYFDPLMRMLAHTVEQGFMRAACVDLLRVAHEPDALLDEFVDYQAPLADKWGEARNAV